jgi:trk system potassium uptake protein TrkH
VVATARVVAMIYCGLTALGFLVYLAAGMPPFAALLHVMSTLSTGGFSPYPDSIGHYPNPFVRLAVVVFMLVGSTSFSLYYLARSEGPRRFWRDRQLRVLLGLVGMASLVFFAIQGWHIEALEISVFEAVSALTTTGFNVRDAAAWTESVKLIMLLLMVLGGSTGSTAGGIKLLRFLILCRLMNWLVLREILPEEAQIPIKYGDLVISNNELRQHSGFVILYLAFLCFSALFLTLAGHPFIDALFESASALGTVGLSVGITSAELPSWEKLLLIVNMWAGRVEILPVLVILYPWTWGPRRRTT